jgi:hypothetical protein
VDGPGAGVIRRVDIDPPGPDDATVRTLYSAVSRGTESLVFHGATPASQYARMRAPFQDGKLPGPVKYGYLNVGLAEHGSEALRGRPVFCLFPHQTRYVVPATAVTPLPDGVPAARACSPGPSSDEADHAVPRPVTLLRPECRDRRGRPPALRAAVAKAAQPSAPAIAVAVCTPNAAWAAESMSASRTGVSCNRIGRVHRYLLVRGSRPSLIG